MANRGRSLFVFKLVLGLGPAPIGSKPVPNKKGTQILEPVPGPGSTTRFQEPVPKPGSKNPVTPVMTDVENKGYGTRIHSQRCHTLNIL
ncbi:hypothetical protein OUZ56_029448 [Daphnia magna]|uniref:Uncharacterized protein n=1 Tax=Daphnia magna TaxID=35525 RepID=A0ABR0B7A1_9CRUS|nr:hypothetical protein OUZ56_029448 [Daphnia magna]